MPAMLAAPIIWSSNHPKVSGVPRDLWIIELLLYVSSKCIRRAEESRILSKNKQTWTQNLIVGTKKIPPPSGVQMMANKYFKACSPHKLTDSQSIIRTGPRHVSLARHLFQGCHYSVSLVLCAWLNSFFSYHCTSFITAPLHQRTHLWQQHDDWIENKKFLHKF